MSKTRITLGLVGAGPASKLVAGEADMADSYKAAIRSLD